MPQRDGYAHGTPGWVDLSTADTEGSKAFYGELFGWSWEDQEGLGGGFVYSIARMDGRAVAGLGPTPSEMVEAGVRAAWNTYLIVDSADVAHQAVLDAGGRSLARPFDVMSAGRMAFVMDDQGACSGLWQAGLHIGAQLVNEPGALTWVELYVPDAETAAQFYAAALGLDTETSVMGEDPDTAWKVGDQVVGPASVVATVMGSQAYTAWKVGDQVVGGLLKLPMEGVPPQWHVYFGAADVGEMATKVADLGGNVFAGPMPTPAGSVLVIQDPCGGFFSVMQLNEWPTA